MTETLKISRAEYEKYRGRDVAIIRGRVVGSGKNAKEALQEALRRNPKLKPEGVSIYFIPAADELVV